MSEDTKSIKKPLVKFDDGIIPFSALEILPLHLLRMYHLIFMHCMKYGSCNSTTKDFSERLGKTIRLISKNIRALKDRKLIKIENYSLFGIEGGSMRVITLTESKLLEKMKAVYKIKDIGM